MERKLFREYRFKFYLNASHSIIIAGHQGEVHPHTWEFTVDILIQREGFQEFNIFEKAIEQFLMTYQNHTMNDIEPFTNIVPTLENIVDYFGEALRTLIRDTGGELMRIEGSETPTRSYIVSYTHTSEYLASVDQSAQSSLSQVINHLLDDMI